MAQHKPGSLKQSNKKHKGKDGKRAQNKSMGAGKTNCVRKSAKSNAQKSISNKADRLNRNNQLKKIKRDNVWLQKRAGAASGNSSHVVTKVIGILPLADGASAAVCLQECFRQLNVPLSAPVDGSRSVYHAYDAVEKTQFTFVVPPAGLQRDLFYALELARAVDVLMFAVSAGSADPSALSLIDETGLSTISALKAMGCPDALFCLDSAAPSELQDGAMEEEEHSKGRAKHSRAQGPSKKVVHQQIQDAAMLPDTRIIDIDSSAGAAGNNMLARTLRNLTPKPVTWRAQRSYLLADAESVSIQAQEGAAGVCRVKLCGYLRGKPMQAHSLMHLVGAGAGRVVRISQALPPSNGGGAKERSGADAVAVQADKARQESLQLEASGNSLMGEQTWPTEEELMMAGGPEGEAEAGDRNAGRDRRVLKADQLVPKGMSSYQADWFMDEEGELDFTSSGTKGTAAAVAAGASAGAEDGEGDGSSIGDECEEFTLGGGTVSGKKSVAGSGYNSRGVAYTLKERQELDEAFPDEMDTPDDVSARLRFARYRALQSFRASPWHPKENLPQDYARIFQFENFGGTQRRLLAESKAAEQLQLQGALQSRKDAKSSAAGSASVCGASVVAGKGRGAQAAQSSADVESDMELEGDDAEEDGEGSEGSESGSEEEEAAAAMQDDSHENAAISGGLLIPGSDDFIQTGQYVCIELEDVPLLVAERLRQYGFLLAYALYAHEQKLSVLHFHVQKYGAYTEPLKSKDEVLFMVGFRSFFAKPVYSESNLNCDKHKFERFLLPDRFSMASCYGPTSVSTCPLLVFKRAAYAGEDGGFRGACGSEWSLVATGSLANVEPDRIMLKKIILTGFPIRVRKRFAVVRHMFHEPQDVRWFKPAELVTKWGLRGHITEPVGTHGLLKALFNGAIKQNDTVMLILYKRVYPKFPGVGLQLQ